MAKRHFMELLRAKWAEGKFVCVGLDSELGRLPQPELSIAQRILTFNRGIVAATADHVCAFKANIAFYEREGESGLCALRETIRFIHERYPDVPVILDAKRADIGRTNLGYVCAVFEDLKADAVTVNPYLGEEALRPFLDREEKGVIVLCKTSNPGSHEFQDVSVNVGAQVKSEMGLPVWRGRYANITANVPMYLYVAHRVGKVWNRHGNCAIVVGATYPRELELVRQIVPDLPLLIPGIGTQGGDVEATVRAARHNMIINSSSGIIFSDNPHAATQRLDSQIRRTLAEVS